MNRTDTHEQHQQLQAEVEAASQRGRRRRRWVVGAVAAGVAALVGSVLIFATVGDPTRSEPAEGHQTTEEEVAQRFVQAFAAGDADRVASYLAPGAMADWRRQLRDNEVGVVPTS